MNHAAAGEDTSSVRVTSPCGANRIELTAIGDLSSGLGINVSRGGRPILGLTSFLAHLSEGDRLSGAATLGQVERATIDESFALPWGKTKTVPNHYDRASDHPPQYTMEHRSGGLR